MIDLEELPNAYDEIVSTLPAPGANGKAIGINTQPNWMNLVPGQERPNVVTPMKPEAQMNEITPKPLQNVTPSKKAPSDLVSSFFDPPPAPKYDAARQERIKQIAKVNAIGEGLKSLGDIFSLATGANVIARQPNQDAQRAYAAWQQYEDMYAHRLDEYNRQLWNQKLQQLYRGQEWDWRKYQAEKDEEWKKQNQSNVDRQFRSMEADREERRRNQAEDNEIRKKQVESGIKAQEANTAQGWASINQRKKEFEYEQGLRSSGGKTKGPEYTLYFSDGTQVPIENKLERDKILALILSDKNIKLPVGQEDLDLLMPKFGAPITSEAVDRIVQKYGEYSPATIDYINNKYGLNIGRSQRAYSTPWTTGQGSTIPYRAGYQPVNTGTTKPQTQPKPDAQQQQKAEPAQPLAGKYPVDITKGNPADIARQIAKMHGKENDIKYIWNTQKSIEDDRKTLDTLSGLGYGEEAESAPPSALSEFSAFKRPK